jgi:coenzyme PQQ precursor peptide PqqA
VLCGGPQAGYSSGSGSNEAATPEEYTMSWATPTLVEICVGLEINGYLPAEF